MRNFTKYPEMPSAAELIDYGVRMEELGYEFDLGLGPHPARRRAEFSDPRGADHPDSDRGTHDQDQDRHRHPGHAGAQSGAAGQGAGDHRSRLERQAAPGRRGGLVQARVRLAGHRLHPARQDHGAEPRDHQAALDRGKGGRQLSALQPARRRALSQARAEAAPADPDRRLCRRRAEARRHQGRRLAHLLLHRRKLQEVLGQRSAPSPRKPAATPTNSPPPTSFPSASARAPRSRRP